MKVPYSWLREYCDPGMDPAAMVAAYAGRWNLEAAFGELATCLNSEIER